MTDRVALWHQLRADPDWTPEWSRFMGARPPTEPGANREWGDGLGKRGAHRIADISYAADYVLCTCGWIGSAWGDEYASHHKGGQRLLTGEAADDTEVADFLSNVRSSDRQQSVSLSSYVGGGASSAPSWTPDHGYALLWAIINDEQLLDRYLTGVGE